jgi:hypothetical protein
MKIVILCGISLMFVVSALAQTQRSITCKVQQIENTPSCRFYKVYIGPGDVVSIKTDPANATADKVEWVIFESSSIYFVPPEIFTKFQNLKWFWAIGQNIYEIKPNTFTNRWKLLSIQIQNNFISFLDENAFKGKIQIFFLFKFCHFFFLS